MKNYGIIGLGAIGSYLAVKLSQSGLTVHCLANTDYSYIRDNGLTLHIDMTKITTFVNVYNNADEMPKCDVILITLKSTSNSILRNILPKLMHHNTSIVLIQNGIGVEQELAEYIQAEKIIGSSCFIKASKLSPGTVHHFGFDIIDLAQYYFDEKITEITETVSYISEDFRKAGINSKADAHLSSLRWKKLITNIPASALSIIFNASTKDLIEDAICYQLLIESFKEVIAVSKKCGSHITDDYIEKSIFGLKALANLPINYVSMKEDFDASKALEIDVIYRNPINIAKRHNAEMQLTTALYQLLIKISNNKSFATITHARNCLLSFYKSLYK